MALGEDLTARVLEDHRTAPIPAKLRETLTFLEKLTRSPEATGREDLEPVRRAGASDAAIEDAIYVCTVFNVIDRIADALDFDVPPPQAMAGTARILLRLGYRF
ncbi:MAG TPA: hypothetical protein VI356_21270 [Myxococcales bacterium]